MSRIEKEFRHIFQKLWFFENLGIFNLLARYLEKYLSYGSLKIWAFNLSARYLEKYLSQGLETWSDERG